MRIKYLQMPSMTPTDLINDNKIVIGSNHIERTRDSSIQWGPINRASFEEKPGNLHPLLSRMIIP